MKAPALVGLVLATAVASSTVGAVAATKYLITSSHQVKPGVISLANLASAVQRSLARADRVHRSGRVVANEPNLSSHIEVPLVAAGPISIAGICERNNIGTLQSEIWVRTSAANTLIDSFGSGSDGALARSASFGPGSLEVLAVVGQGAVNARTFVAVTPDGATITGTVSSATAMPNQGGDCEFTATATA